MSLRKLLCHWQPASTTGHKRYDLPSTLSLRIAQEMWSVSDVTINIASVRPATTLCSAHAPYVLHSRLHSIVDAHVYNIAHIHSHQLANCPHTSLLPHRTHRRRSGRYCAASHHADQQVPGQEANLITLRPETMEIVPGGEFKDGARGIQLRVRSWPQGNLSAMPHVKWEWLVAPGEWVCASEPTRITAQNRGL